MSGAIAWFARNPVAANLAMVVIVLGGLFTLPRVRQELIPDIDLDVISVSVPYPGASPEEVEQSIAIRIEEELQGLPGIDHLRSTSAEGLATVSVELMAGEDVRRRLDDVRSVVDRIDTFPEAAEEPQVKQLEVRHRVLVVAVSGQADEWTLKRLGQQVRDELAARPGISEATLGSTRPYEISIEVSEQALRRHGLRFDELVAAVRRSSMDLPGGSVKTEGGEILLRAKGQAYRGADFERIALVSRTDGTRLTVGDVATVVDGFAESDERVRFDGAPAVMVEVFRVGNQKTLEVARAVREYIDEAAPRMPGNVSLTVWQDDSFVLRDRLDTMVRNARGGFVLVVLVLAMFLRLRLALWVSLGIPISFLGALALMPLQGMSINFISLLAFIVVLGIVVDDAIVVGESVHTEQQRSGEKLAGAIRGTHRIVVPVTFGVLTTVAAFAPMLFLPGPMGRMTRVVPVVVITCLLVSLFESLFILPNHLGHGRKALDAPPTTRISRSWRRFQAKVEAALHRVIHHHYRASLERALEWRYLTLSLAPAMLLLTLGLIGGGWLEFVFQEEVEGDVIVADLTMLEGTPARATERALAELESALVAVRAEVDATREPEQGSVFRHVLVRTGAQPFLTLRTPPGMGRTQSYSASHLGEIVVDVVGFQEREESLGELTRRWRERSGEISGVRQLRFTSALMDTGAPLEVALTGPTLGGLRAAAAAVKRTFAGYPGVYEISDSFRRGKQELELQILPSAEALGLTLADLGTQVRQGFYGAEAQSIQRGRDEVKVMVRYPAGERRSLSDVTRMRIRGVDGTEVPFSSVARARLRAGYSNIERLDRERVVSVTADVDTAVANANEIVADLKAGALQAVLAEHPGVRFSFEGQQADQREFLHAQAIGFGAALLVIYALLAVPLGSYVQPFLIMSAIPFGAVGAVWGHLLLGYDLTMYSVIGLIALAGVVVNASLVLVDFVNQRIAEGAPIETAIRDAASERFRPILLTSVTTFLGLTPLMLESSVQARFMIPMAISLAFGVLFASSITLYLVPTAYLALDDLQRAWERRFGRGARPRLEMAGGLGGRAVADVRSEAAAPPR